VGRLQATKFKEKDSQYERQREPKKGSREREDASQLESLHGGLFQQDGVVALLTPEISSTIFPDDQLVIITSDKYHI